MTFNHVSPQQMETLEQYAVALVVGLISLQSLVGFHKRALDLGILEEDEQCTLNTIVWDIERLTKLYNIQAASVLERLPDTISVQSILDSLKAKELPRRRRSNGKV